MMLSFDAAGDATGYLNDVPTLPPDLLALVELEASEERRLSRDERRRLNRAMSRLKRRIRLERELWEVENGPIEVEPPPAH